jgi:Tfp pilus assembly protein PilN
MIKINLALKKASGVSAAAPATESGIDLSQINSGPIRVVVLSVIAIMGTDWAVQREKDVLLQALKQDEQKLASKKQELQASLSKTKQYEEIKRALEADEKVISTKLDTILKLSQDRDGQVRLLQLLSQSIPEEAWVENIKYSPKEIVLKGGALDFNQVSDFTRKLSDSDVLSDVQQENANNGKDSKGQPVVLFELSARRK